MFPTMLSSLTFLFLLPSTPQVLANTSRWVTVPQVTARIDALTSKHWQANQIQPAPLADDATFLRRVTLDLAGRIPTYREATTFATDRSPQKRQQAIKRLLTSPEYPLHLGRVLDEMIQGKYAGNAEFIEYLRSAVAQHRGWDCIFREIMLGPWHTKERKRADYFLTRRLNNLDDLTNDTARVFFGVNVSCAKCHDHPLVADWKQDHYYGMVSFFNPTYEGSKARRRDGAIMEKLVGDVTFLTTKGVRRNAKVMFLSSRVLNDSAAKSPNRREQLVQIALDEKHFFSRAIVNRLWAYLMGRGLVQPVDQMHTANPPAIPGLLEWLADDLAEHGYDLDRLMAALVSSRGYQQASTAPNSSEPPSEKLFAQAQLRPLTPEQYALSIILALGEDTFDRSTAADVRARRYRELEGQAAGLTRLKLLDARTDRFQSSASEALFMSNNAEVQRLLLPAGKNLTARLQATADARQLVQTAIWTVFSRPPEKEELDYLTGWVEERKADRSKACRELIWALLTAAEFRFNH
jgi:hypothetical protein